MFGVLAIVDEKNWNIPRNLVPLYIALLVLSIVLSLGYNTGAAMNPARDLIPRLFTYLAGWGEQTFRYTRHKYHLDDTDGDDSGTVEVI